jgi:hypothetical protein
MTDRTVGARSGLQLPVGDRLELYELYARYSDRMDSADADGWAGVFTPDGRFVVPGRAAADVVGTAALRAFAASRHEHYSGMSHYFSNISLEATEAGARGSAYFWVVRRSPDAALRLRNIGRYDDELVKHDGNWRFLARHVTSWLDPDDEDAAFVFDKPSQRRPEQPGGQLADRIELHELAARYGDLIDARDWVGLARVFTPTVTFDLTDVNGGELHGLESVQRYMDTEALHPEAHLMTNVYVEELGPNDGRMRARLLAVQLDGTVSTGEYHDRVIRTAEGWRIEHRVFKYRRRPAA